MPNKELKVGVQAWVTKVVLGLIDPIPKQDLHRAKFKSNPKPSTCEWHINDEWNPEPSYPT